ncbi:AAA family ATPase [Plantactinospora mayteni]|uniref:Kinase n=1 Tax=Plantactinospora mayteni TaxID=566021 RepID=A0ABQ4EIS7_9ACTN|nr:AAA family ATPase [Plantactinospora mayteni]GIG94520.1 kinase [Plantactinospora mayteni]
MIIAITGLPGTGKSTLARQLAKALHARVLDKDHIRAALFGFEGTTYTRGQDDFVVGIIYRTTARLLAEDPTRTVILDGRTYSQTYQVEAVRRLATSLRQPLKIIECRCDDTTARNRLRRDRTADNHPAANRDPSLHSTLKAQAHPIPGPKLVIDTNKPQSEVLHACLDYLSN